MHSRYSRPFGFARTAKAMPQAPGAPGVTARREVGLDAAGQAVAVASVGFAGEQRGGGDAVASEAPVGGFADVTARGAGVGEVFA